MNWLKVGAVVVGGIVVFFVVDSLIHVFLGLLTAIVFVAIVGGGVYAAAKIHGARKRRELRQRPEYYEEQQARHHSRQARDERTAVVRPAPGKPAPGTTASHHDVEDDLARLKREMGS
ncbi:MAG TPA: hypothetical protein VF060_31520 [Trebonia sp.]